MIYCFTETAYNKGYKEFNYNSNGELIEEIDFWDIEDNNYQRYEHKYKNGLIEKTLFYHDTSLAYIYEYFYKDTLLKKEIKTRITEAEHFRERKKEEIIEYHYEYFQ